MESGLFFVLVIVRIVVELKDKCKKVNKLQTIAHDWRPIIYE